MDQGQAFLSATDLVEPEKLLKGSPCAITVAVDNGYIVIFQPAKGRLKAATLFPRVRPPGVGSPMLPEDEEKLMNAGIERRREVAVHTERSKMRVRVYPALSQAMDEIKKFYEGGGVVPGIDFEKRAEESVGDYTEGDVIA